MFRELPILYYTVPKSRHYILSGLATLLVLLSSVLVGLSIGTDHWRESKYPGYNVTKVTQGLIKECDWINHKIVCSSVMSSRFLQGFLGVIKITHSILIGSLTFGFLALLTSLFASFHKTSVLVTATVALEITSAFTILFAVSIYTAYFGFGVWIFGWSYALVWIAFLAMTTASILHFIVQDVKFLVIMDYELIRVSKSTNR